MRLTKLWTEIRSGLWFIPLMYAVVGVVLNVVTVGLDRANDYEALPAAWFGGPDASLAILGTVAASMISLVATVLACWAWWRLLGKGPIERAMGLVTDRIG